jgi:hypothetical protein
VLRNVWCAFYNKKKQSKGAMNPELLPSRLQARALQSNQRYIDEHVANVLHDANAILGGWRELATRGCGMGYAVTEVHNDMHYALLVKHMGGSCHVCVKVPDRVYRMDGTTPEPEEHVRHRRRVEDVKYFLSKWWNPGEVAQSGRSSLAHPWDGFQLEWPSDCKFCHESLAHEKLDAVLQAAEGR